MNREDIIRMAKEAGGYQFNSAPAHWDDEDFAMSPDDLAKFAALVAAAEREACAALADREAKRWNEYRESYQSIDDKHGAQRTWVRKLVAEGLASAIRARGK